MNAKGPSILWILIFASLVAAEDPQNQAFPIPSPSTQLNDGWDKTLLTKFAAAFAFWVTILIAGGVPLFSPMSLSVLSYARMFVAGVFLSTAVIHLLSISVETFNSLNYSGYPFALFFVVLGVLLAQLTAMIGNTVRQRHAAKQQKEYSQGLELVSMHAQAQQSLLVSPMDMATFEKLEYASKKEGEIESAKKGRNQDDDDEEEHIEVTLTPLTPMTTVPLTPAPVEGLPSQSPSSFPSLGERKEEEEGYRGQGEESYMRPDATSPFATFAATSTTTSRPTTDRRGGYTSTPIGTNHRNYVTTTPSPSQEAGGHYMSYGPYTPQIEGDEGRDRFGRMQTRTPIAGVVIGTPTPLMASPGVHAFPSKTPLNTPMTPGESMDRAEQEARDYEEAKAAALEEIDLHSSTDGGVHLRSSLSSSSSASSSSSSSSSSASSSLHAKGRASSSFSGAQDSPASLSGQRKGGIKKTAITNSATKNVRFREEGDQRFKIQSLPDASPLRPFDNLPPVTENSREGLIDGSGSSSAPSSASLPPSASSSSSSSVLSHQSIAPYSATKHNALLQFNTPNGGATTVRNPMFPSLPRVPIEISAKITHLKRQSMTATAMTLVCCLVAATFLEGLVVGVQPTANDASILAYGLLLHEVLEVATFAITVFHLIEGTARQYTYTIALSFFAPFGLIMGMMISHLVSDYTQSWLTAVVDGLVGGFMINMALISMIAREMGVFPRWVKANSYNDEQTLPLPASTKAGARGVYTRFLATLLGAGTGAALLIRQFN